MALGISLGGHSVWHLLLHEPCITTGIVVVGCPDYLELMKDRARLSKLSAWTSSKPPGSSFIGSEYFPDALVHAVRKYDPTAYYFGVSQQFPEKREDSEHHQAQAQLLDKTLRGKRILNLAGGADKLVPYEKSKRFMNWLRTATGPQGWYRHGADIVVEDIVYQGVGHEMTSEMLEESVQFLTTSLSKASKTSSSKL